MALGGREKKSGKEDTDIHIYFLTRFWAFTPSSGQTFVRGCTGVSSGSFTKPGDMLDKAPDQQCEENCPGN